MRRQDRADQLTFDFSAARERRERGIAEAEVSRAEVLELARRIAVRLAESREDRTVTADDVQRELIAQGYGPAALGNAAGSIFRGRRWVFTGRWRASERVSNHGHQNRIWQLLR